MATPLVRCFSASWPLAGFPKATILNLGSSSVANAKALNDSYLHIWTANLLAGVSLCKTGAKNINYINDNNMTLMANDIGSMVIVAYLIVQLIPALQGLFALQACAATSCKAV